MTYDPRRKRLLSCVMDRYNFLVIFSLKRLRKYLFEIKLFLHDPPILCKFFLA